MSVYYACSDIFETSQLSKIIIQNIATINVCGIWVCTKHIYTLLYSMFTYIGVGFALSVLIMIGNAKASKMWNDNCRVHVFFMPILSSTLGPKRAMEYADKQSNFA